MAALRICSDLRYSAPYPTDESSQAIEYISSSYLYWAPVQAYVKQPIIFWTRKLKEKQKLLTLYNFVNSSLGWFHLAAALLAMLVGAFVLATPKGTKRHKQVGYIYVVSMILVCASAMSIYRLTGRFGIFHVTAIFGFLTLAGGMIPMFMKNIDRKYKAVHIWFMYYSVLGLYAAFASELSVRIPERPFYTMVGIATGTIFTVGTIFILKKEKVWTKYFG